MVVARRGGVGLGVARLGGPGLVWSGRAWHVMVRLGMAVADRPGEAGPVGSRRVVTARLGEAVEAVEAGHGKVRRGRELLVKARRGLVRRGG